MSRYYSFRLITYVSESTIQKVCKEICNHYAYIYHNKDTKEDGTLKEPHWHIVCTTKQQKSLNTIREAFADESGQNTLAKVADDMKEAYEYLWHKDDENKYQYNKKDVKVDDEEYWRKVSKDEVNSTSKNEEFINDLFNYNPLQMARKYGKDYIKNFDRYDSFRRYIRDELSRKQGFWQYDYYDDIDLFENIYATNNEIKNENKSK